MLDPQKTPHTSPKRASYGVSFVNIYEKIDRVIEALHCMWNSLTECLLPQGLFQPDSDFKMVTSHDITSDPRHWSFFLKQAFCYTFYPDGFTVARDKGTYPFAMLGVTGSYVRNSWGFGAWEYIHRDKDLTLIVENADRRADRSQTRHCLKGAISDGVFIDDHLHKH